MSEPTFPRPVPGPGPGVPGSGPGTADGPATAETTDRGAVGSVERFAGLAERPVAEHVEVFEAEHGRLQSELGTIDGL